MTYHLQNLPKGNWPIKTRKIQVGGQELLRIKVNSRLARKLRRAGAELVKP